MARAQAKAKEHKLLAMRRVIKGRHAKLAQEKAAREAQAEIREQKRQTEEQKKAEEKVRIAKEKEKMRCAKEEALVRRLTKSTKSSAPKRVMHGPASLHQPPSAAHSVGAQSADKTFLSLYDMNEINRKRFEAEANSRLAKALSNRKQTSLSPAPAAAATADADSRLPEEVIISS